ncbi:hypothetical protein VN97_g1783 [Penicillium thymicola]|uniref:Uncharacterized protein n=1 Tax=Penicillium thymicola TaxID=293382 RepID=A0AAI9TQZ7_PENTH|nr:hypothetical protein VN97_g1783 [Penicillium thymicola]
MLSVHQLALFGGSWRNEEQKKLPMEVAKYLSFSNVPPAIAEKLSLRGTRQMFNYDTRSMIIKLVTGPHDAASRGMQSTYEPYKDSPTPKLAAKRSANFLQIQYNSSQIQFRFTSDSLQIHIQTSLSIGRLQLITTTLVDLNYYWQYEPITELCAGGILSSP